MLTSAGHWLRRIAGGLGLGLLLVGCATQDGGSEAPGPAIFRGVGQEPGWVLTVRADSVHFSGDYGQWTLTVSRSAVAVDSTAERMVYRADWLDVVIEADPCTDVMSGESFSHTVTVTLHDDTYRGCGRVLR